MVAVKNLKSWRSVLDIFDMKNNEINKFPSVSVIINTDGRAKSLGECLESLKYLKYPNFEVVVVAGPTRDGTHELCRALGDRIVFAECPERNLSMSRNISIAISSGEFVGFLDDDSVPEPEWLDDVMPAFEDSEVGVAGGFLHNHTGKDYQWKFGTLNRFGTADTNWSRPAPEFNFPGSFNYPHVMANSVFRRSAIVEAGGFDEEYEYFLDESDLILRFVDLGWKVAQLDRGFIHHKYMPSHIRNESKVLTSWYSLIKNKTYFSLQNNVGHYDVQDVLREVGSVVDEFRAHVQWASSQGHLAHADAERFEPEVGRALKDGLIRGLSGQRRLPRGDAMKGRDGFVRFSTLTAGETGRQKCFVFLTKTYPPGEIGGIGRYVYQLATEIAKLGHQVHVLTAGQEHDRVDFESGVWVHRIVVKAWSLPSGVDAPQHLWDYSMTMHSEVEEISGRRAVDAVCAPIWDIEGVAFLVKRQFPLVTSLHTTLASYIQANPDKSKDQSFMSSFATPVMEWEARLMRDCDFVIANSRAIVEEIEEKYRFNFDESRFALVPHGMSDWAASEGGGRGEKEGEVVLSFVGRLEYRKGADLFLQVVPFLLSNYPDLTIHMVGDDRVLMDDGFTLKDTFASRNPDLVEEGRIVFHGSVSDQALRRHYASSDIVVAPSRFESFGLVHLEAMVFGKPVVGCRIGGMQEVIEDGVTGLLAEPGDAESLKVTLVRLIEDDDLRIALGEAARARYLRLFSAGEMAKSVILALGGLQE